MVVKEYLDSDRVNFLIWRYLLEGNYRETAAKFQKEWRVREPHRDFDFAEHVKSHALVSVINRGLVYSALERQHTKNEFAHDATAQAEKLQVGIFGPLITQPPAKVEAHDSVDETARIPATSLPPPSTGLQPGEEADASRKRLPQQLPNGSPVKRPRLSNGYDHGPSETPAPVTTMPMDIDTQENQVSQPHDNHAYPSPLEGEQAPTPIVHTDGPEQGTQVDKVEELLPETTFIRLVDDARQTNDTNDATVGPTNAPIILQCEWNPKDPSILAAAGTDALAHVWTVPHGTNSEGEAARDHVFSNGLPLLDPEAPSTTTVSALAWTSDGTTLAVAVNLESKAAIHICSADGILLQTLAPSEPPVVKLCWNPSNTALLAISPDKGAALVTVYYASKGNSLSYRVPDYEILNSPLDATWTNDFEFILGGGDMLIGLSCSDASIHETRKFGTEKDDSFTQVLFDWRSKLTATSSEKGTLDLWDESGARKSVVAHQGAITTMAWQPLPPTHPNVNDERLIATGGEDCAILIWNAKAPGSKAKCFLNMDSPIVRLAFTPDGAFLAGATSSQVLIWKVGSTAMPRATWSRPPHPGWLSPKANSDSDEEDEHCLCWDASGHKLAYGSNSRLAVINFSR